MRRNCSSDDGNMRTALIVVLAVLIVLCLLILPWFCSSRTSSPEPTIVHREVPSPSVRYGSNNSASTENPANQENPNPIDTTESIVEKNDQKPRDTTYIEPITPTPNYPDFANTTSPTEADLQDNSTSSASDEQRSTETIAQEEIEPTSENPQSAIHSSPGEEQTDEDDPTAIKKPSVLPRNIPVNPTSNPGAVSHENQPLPPIPQNNNVNSKEAGLIFWVVILVILLICYIIARVRSKRGDLVITANIFDKILIIVSPILFFIVWCVGFDHELTPLQIILLVLSVMMLIGSILFSIFANLGNIFNIIISILAKIFIFIFTNFLLLLLVMIVVFSFMRAVTSHNNTEGTYVMKYDHFLNRWLGYRIN